MNEALYPYASQYVLGNPKRYSRSKYLGRPFLRAWSAVRSGAAGEADAEEALEAGEPQQPAVGETTSTPALLEYLFASVDSEKPIDEDVSAWINALVKKFEVTKRVHGGYDGNFRAIDRDDHRNLALYVRLAEMIEVAYARTGAMPYLNVLLKILDTLCALRGELDQGERSRLSGLIERERSHVSCLADRLGVRL